MEPRFEVLMRFLFFVDGFAFVLPSRPTCWIIEFPCFSLGSTRLQDSLRFCGKNTNNNNYNNRIKNKNLLMKLKSIFFT